MGGDLEEGDEDEEDEDEEDDDDDDGGSDPTQVEFAVDDAGGEERVFKTFGEAAGFAVSIAASNGQTVNLDVLVFSPQGARAYGGDDAVDQYNEDPEASVFERIEIRADVVGGELMAEVDFDDEDSVLAEMAEALDIDPDELKIRESHLTSFGAGTVYEITIRQRQERQRMVGRRGRGPNGGARHRGSQAIPRRRT